MERTCGTTPSHPCRSRSRTTSSWWPTRQRSALPLRYTAEGSNDPGDMLMMTNSLFNSLTGEILDNREARMSLALELPHGAGYLKLASSDPTVQPTFNYQYLQHPEDMRRMRDGVRLGAKMLESRRLQERLRDTVDAH